MSALRAACAMGVPARVERASRRWFLVAKYTLFGDRRPIDRPPS